MADVITLAPVEIVSLTDATWKRLGGVIADLSFLIFNHENAVFSNRQFKISYSAAGRAPDMRMQDDWSWVEFAATNSAGQMQLSGMRLWTMGSLAIESTMEVQAPLEGIKNPFGNGPIMGSKTVPVVGTTFVCPTPRDAAILFQVSHRTETKTVTKSRETNSDRSSERSNKAGGGLKAGYGGVEGSLSVEEGRTEKSGSSTKEGQSTSETVSVATQRFDIQIVKGGTCK